MKRLITLVAAFASSAMLLSSAAFAQPTGYYSATPVAAPTKAMLITSGTLWKCADGVCAAPEGTARDAVMCQMVVQQIGALSTFTVAGKPMAADALAKCNARAK